MTTQSLTSWPSWLPRRLLTIEDLAEIFQVSTRTARRMVDSGRLPRAPLGGRVVRVRPEAVVALLNGQEAAEEDHKGQDKLQR